MTRAITPPCRRDLACYRNDGHPEDHAYATPDTVPSPAPIWQAGYDAGYREAQQDIALAAASAPSPDAPGLREVMVDALDVRLPYLDTDALYRALLAVENHGAPIVPTDYLAIAAAYTAESEAGITQRARNGGVRGDS